MKKFHDHEKRRESLAKTEERRMEYEECSEMRAEVGNQSC